jgi:hypothetical protein
MAIEYTNRSVNTEKDTTIVQNHIDERNFTARGLFDLSFWAETTSIWCRGEGGGAPRIMLDGVVVRRPAIQAISGVSLHVLAFIRHLL